MADSWAKDLMGQIKWAAQNSGGSGMGGMAAMLGIPFQQKRGGQWMTIDPRQKSVYASGTTPPPMQQAQQPTTGGDGPPLTDEEQKKEDLVKAGLAPWYVDWLNTNGQYGQWKKPPGLLG